MTTLKFDNEKIKDYLKDNLSEKRYKHSLGVAETAESLAQTYFYADKEKAYLTGLIHDVAKELPFDKAKELLEGKYGVLLDQVTKNTNKLLHGPLGACMAQDIFGICDAEVFDAIRYHTTAKANMGLLTKIVYIADYVEPSRDFDGVEELREMAYKDLDGAILTGLNFTVEELVQKGAMLHPDTVHARNYIILKNISK